MPPAVAISVLAVVAFFFVSVGSPAQVSASKTKETKWKLVWREEFNGPKGSTVDQGKWVFDIGAKTWGNEELESYTNRPENVAIQDGNLVISGATRELHGARRYKGELHLRKDEDSGQILPDIRPFRSPYQSSLRPGHVAGFLDVRR